MTLREIEDVVRRAVHRLWGHVVLARLAIENEEHVLAVLPPVARLLPEELVVEERGLDLLKVLALTLADEVDERVVEKGPALGPEDRARRNGAHQIEIELAPELAMVAALRFLDAVEIRLEVLLLPPSGAVDALQLLPPLVATPIRRCHRSQLDCLDIRGIGNVRPATEIDEGSVGVGRDDLILAELTQPLELERIVDEDLLGSGTRKLGADEGVFLRRHLFHLGLERGEIFGSEWLVDLEVVVEAVLDRGTEADFCFRPEPTHRGREDVRGGVPEHVERARIFSC